MKKVSSQTTSAWSIILLAFVAVFAFGQLIFCLISPNTVLEWLKNAHLAYYSVSTAVTPKIMSYIMKQSFENLFNTTYIRVMSMYIFVLCIPLCYALVNIFFISQNGASDKPFRSSTSECLRTVTISFAVEIVFATVLYVILKIVMRVLPFYFLYTMIAVALYSLCMIVFAATISSLINRMGDLKEEHAKMKLAQKKKRKAAAASLPTREALPRQEEAAPETPEAPKHTVSTSFDDVLDSIDQ